MASFFKNLFRKEGESQPVPATPLANDFPGRGQTGPFVPAAQAGPLTAGVPRGTGPFAVVTGRQMTVREMAALLPPGLLRFDAVSPEQPVALPLEELRQTLASGRPSLRLSRIYEACPALFQRPPAPGEDLEVTFPLARVRGLLENSSPIAPVPAVNPFASIPRAGLPPAGATASPFGLAGSLLPSAASPGNPFAPMMNAAASGLPIARPGMPVAQEQPQPFPAAPVTGFPSAPPASSPAPAAVAPFAVAAAAPGLPAAPSAFSPASPAQASPAPALPPGPRSTPVPFAQSAGKQPASHSGAPHSPFSVINPPAATAPPAAFVPAGNPLPSPFTVRASAPVPAPAAFQPAAQPRTFPVPVAPPAMNGRPESIKTSPRPDRGSRFSTQPVPLPVQAQTAPPVTQPVPPPAALPVLSFPSSFQSITAPVPPTDPVLPPAAAPAMPSPSAPAPAQPAGPAPAMASTPAVSLPDATPPATDAPAGFLEESMEATAESMEMSLRAVLRNADPALLGFAPENVPEAVRIRFPVAQIAPQLSKGRVVVSIPQICQGIPEKFRPAFARASTGMTIVVPMSEVFHNLPESARPSMEPAAPADAHQPITTSPFQTPFVIRAEDEPGKQLLDLSVTGFDKSNVRQARPATQPVGPVELPHAPLPPVTVDGGAPTVQVDLPPLRPAGMMAPAETPLAAPLTRSGMLSRPPGSGTGPSPGAAMRTAPAVKPVPPSASAVRAFPKPAMPPDRRIVPVVPQLPPAFPVSPAGGAPPLTLPRPVQAAPPPAFTPHGLDLGPASAAVLANASPARPGADPTDDLGESFSAARLGTEPPPRAGSAPVSRPAFPLPGNPPPLAAGPAAPLPTPVAPFAASPAPLAPPVWPPVPPRAAASGLNGKASATIPKLAAPSRPAAAGSALPSPAPRAPQDLPTGQFEDLSFGCQPDQQQIVLRALFGTDRTFTPQDVADACATLPGLKACAILSEGLPLVSGGLPQAEASTFRDSVARTRESLSSLAESMGLGSGGNFTLRTDQGVRSFFLDSGLCLAVWHDQPLFSGGTREKLILITQELAKL